MKKVQLEEMKSAWEQGCQKEFFLMYGVSEVKAGRTAEAELELSDEITKIHFFDPEEEIRIYMTEDGWKAVSLQKDDNDCVEKEYTIKNKKFGNKLIAAQELSVDEDGQAYVEDVRLVRWEG